MCVIYACITFAPFCQFGRSGTHSVTSNNSYANSMPTNDMQVLCHSYVLYLFCILRSSISRSKMRLSESGTWVWLNYLIALHAIYRTLIEQVIHRLLTDFKHNPCQVFSLNICFLCSKYAMLNAPTTNRRYKHGY